MRLCLVEDHAAAGLEPLTLTRPVHELRLGATTLGQKIARAFDIGPGPARRGGVIRSHLLPLMRQRDPRTTWNDPEWLARGPVTVVVSRFVPAAGFEFPSGLGHRSWLGLCEGRPAVAIVGPDAAAGLPLTPAGVDGWFDELRAAAEVADVPGQWIDRPWDLVALNAEHLERDFQVAAEHRVSNRHLSALALVGPSERLLIHETARIDPYTVFDTTNGPITLESGVWVQPFTRIEGPCHIGQETQLFRANLRGAVTIGPNCRIGGEVEASIVHGFSNKYHEGFLGHAYVGEWVNLGAITSNSDLRNDYGEVFVPLQGDAVATGMAKVGCFVGDHTRTGLGSMLNTGTSIGVMCNVLPAGWLLPKHIPSFSAVRYGRVAPGFPLEQMFGTARVVMSRRQRRLSEIEEQLYRTLYEQTRLERERAFQKSREPRADPWPLASAASQ